MVTEKSKTDRVVNFDTSQPQAKRKHRKLKRQADPAIIIKDKESRPTSNRARIRKKRREEKLKSSHAPKGILKKRKVKFGNEVNENKEDGGTVKEIKGYNNLHEFVDAGEDELDDDAPPPVNDSEEQENMEVDEHVNLNLVDKEPVIRTSDGEKCQQKIMNMEHLHDRMNDKMEVLVNWKNSKEKNGMSKSEYMTCFRDDLCMYYSANEFFIDNILKLFSIKEAIEFLEASEAQRPVTIRTNTLKAHRRDLAKVLINRGVNLDPLGTWTKEGLVIYESQVPIGATPEYMAGHYMIQGASSLMPVEALDAKVNEKVLDMCAAPGGKTTHIGAMMRNTGIIVANDVNADRLKAVYANIHRMGLMNCIVTNVDGREITKHVLDIDRCLVDAPCTGTGVTSKDPAAKCSKEATDVQRCSTIQRQLLLAAIDAVRPKCSEHPGIVVYSTCSVLVEENEAVIQYALFKRPNVHLVETGLNIGEDGFVRYREHRFHPSMKLCKRYYPHMHNMDGFFVAKLEKSTSLKTNHKESKPDVARNGNIGLKDKTNKQKEKGKPLSANQNDSNMKKNKTKLGKPLNKISLHSKKAKRDAGKKKNKQKFNKRSDE